VAADYFLFVEGIPGESKDQRYRDQIDVESWTWGQARPFAPVPMEPSKPTFQDLAVAKRIDRSSPQLALACVQGQHLRRAVLTGQRTERWGPFEFLKSR
jgi:type VI secretion system secreted protein Hcp